MNEHAYSTSDPTVVTAYRAACDGYRDMSRRTSEDAETLGNNRGALISSNVFAGPHIVGLAADDPASPPAGWVYSKRNNCLVPQRGKTGDAARQWIDAHQPPDVREVLAGHGLPRMSQYTRGDTYVRALPELFEHGGTLWARYRGDVDGVCTWERRRLSEFHAARESAEAAEGAGVAA